VTAPILQGAEPYSATGDARGALVLHGFTGNPQSMRGLAVALADAGFTVEMPLLPGHGTAVEDMLPTRWEDWSAAAESAYVDLAARCEAVVVVGLSMGGSLTVWLGEHHPEIAGLVLVNPLIVPPAELEEGVKALIEAGEETIPGIGSDIALEGAVESAYSLLPLQAAHRITWLIPSPANAWPRRSRARSSALCLSGASTWRPLTTTRTRSRPGLLRLPASSCRRREHERLERAGWSQP
jgi:pimeloyl-ACP methyl ester carboxylesterase